MKIKQCVAITTILLVLLLPSLWMMWSINKTQQHTSSMHYYNNDRFNNNNNNNNNNNFFDPSIPCIIQIHVITERSHFNERQDIRLTWGATARKLGMDVRFLMNHIESEETTWIKTALIEEQNMHHDLIKINSPRGERNLAFVIAGGLKSYVESKSTCRYFMKVDRGIYLLPSKLLTVLKKAENKTRKNRLNGNQNGGFRKDGEGAGIENNMIYMGHIWLKGRVIRDKTSQWYIAGGIIEKLGQHTKFYPPYASGTAYLLSQKLANSLIVNEDNGKDGCFSPLKVNAGPEDAQLGICIDQLMKTSSNEVTFIRSKAFNTNKCDAQSVVVDIASSSLSSSSVDVSVSRGVSSSILFHTHALHLDGESLCNTNAQKQNSKKSTLRIPHVLVAVTTSLKSFEKRGKAIVRTWGSPQNLKETHAIIRFFIGEDAESKILEICDRIGIDHDMVVALPGVLDNEYPPVLKNTAMLATMNIMMSTTNEYDWVIKVDDDTLINFYGLTFLSKFDPLQQHLYLGQQGTGVPADRGKLGIIKPFCMGGPGYIISRAALHILGPKLKQW